MVGPNYKTLVITERRACLDRSLRGADAFLKLLHVLVILGHERRRLIRFGVTAPSAEWFARQVTKAFPRDEAPWHLNRDRDRAFGPAYTRCIRAIGIHDRPTAARSPCRF
jgi:hypothetical protein